MPSASKLARDLIKLLSPEKAYHISSKEGSRLAGMYKDLGPETLYRFEGPGARLRAVGELAETEVGNMMKPTEPRGLYFADRVKDLPHLIDPFTHNEGSTIEAIGDLLSSYRSEAVTHKDIKESLATQFIRARLLPEAKLLDVSDIEDWNDTLERFATKHLKGRDIEGFYRDKAEWSTRQKMARDFTSYLKQDYDAIRFPDTAADQPEVAQTVLLNKGKAIGRQGEYYKLLGLGGAFTAAMTLSEADEAEAFPIGDLLKGSAKAVQKVKKAGIPSRTAKLLKGTEFRGKKIVDVLKVDDDWRHIHLDDGSVYPVTKDVASNLVRKVGTVQKMQELGTKDTEGQLTQALKSLVYHETRSKGTTPEATRQIYKDYLKQLEDAGVAHEAVPYSLVRRGDREFTLPREYATILAREGHVTILEGKELLNRPVKSGRKLQLFPWGRK